MSYRLTIRDMTIDDVPRLKLDEDWMYERYKKYIECQLGPAKMITEEGQALCAFGAIFEWKWGGACQIWFNIIEYKRTFNIARIFKRLLVDLATQYGITRMEAVVRCDNRINNRWMEFLGFENETPCGMKKKLFGGHDAYLYSKGF